AIHLWWLAEFEEPTVSVAEGVRVASRRRDADNVVAVIPIARNGSGIGAQHRGDPPSEITPVPCGLVQGVGGRRYPAVRAPRKSGVATIALRYPPSDHCLPEVVVLPALPGDSWHL